VCLDVHSLLTDSLLTSVLPPRYLRVYLYSCLRTLTIMVMVDDFYQIHHTHALGAHMYGFFCVVILESEEGTHAVVALSLWRDPHFPTWRPCCFLGGSAERGRGHPSNVTKSERVDQGPLLEGRRSLLRELRVRPLSTVKLSVNHLYETGSSTCV